MTSIRTEALSAHQHAVNRSKSFNAGLRKYRAANTLAVMMVAVCGMAAGVLLFQWSLNQAEEHYRADAKRTQEQIAWNR